MPSATTLRQRKAVARRSLLNQRRPTRSLVEMAIDQGEDSGAEVLDDIERKWGGKGAQDTIETIRQTVGGSKLTAAQKCDVIEQTLKSALVVAKDAERAKADGKPNKAIEESRRRYTREITETTELLESQSSKSRGGRKSSSTPRLINARAGR